MKSIILAGAIALTNLYASTNYNYLEFHVDTNRYTDVLVITNCPAVKCGDVYLPKLTGEQWNTITKYFNTTNLTVRFTTDKSIKAVAQ